MPVGGLTPFAAGGFLFVMAKTIEEETQQGGWMSGMNGIWKAIAIASLGVMSGWWSRQLTLEIPPQWFREDVQQNTQSIGQHEQRIDQLEKADRYGVVVERLIELERQVKQ